jgi:hypothetical protein
MQITTQANLVYRQNRLCYRDPNMFQSYKTTINLYTLLNESFMIHIYKTLRP